MTNEEERGMVEELGKVEGDGIRPEEQKLSDLAKLLIRMGRRMGFEVKGEVEASESAWVDVVWFDHRLGPSSYGVAKPKLRQHPLLPMVGFEIEICTGLKAKHVKGSVTNLNNLGAVMGIVVVGEDNLKQLRRLKSSASKTTEQLRDELCERVYRWVYAEAQPRNRVVVMSENEVRKWGGRVVPNAPELKSQGTFVG